jgi:cytochrome c-type biogenesis protein CcmH/NrfG
MASIALALAWTTWQPLRSADAEQAALTELSRGNFNAALADARTARSRNPVSVGPLWDLSAIYDSIGNRTAAHGELVQAVRLQPSNAATWVQLAQYDLQLGKLQEATAALRAALFLGPHERATLTAVEQANAALARAAAPPPTRRVRGHRPRLPR